MTTKLIGVTVILFLLVFIRNALLQGSGENGNLRLCVVEGRGSFKRVTKFCPVLDKEKSGLECVLGTDRLDCLIRISKGTVDFGVFSPEDLVAAQWANVDVLVTNELRSRAKPFERSIVAVASKRILPERASSLHNVMRNSSLCHPGAGVDDIRPLSETLTGYLESLIIPRSCEPQLSLAENKIKALAEFFGRSCKAGPWVLDKHRDDELKNRYSSLCAACSTTCSEHDPYQGGTGALNCLLATGDVTWAELDDVKAYFGLKNRKNNVPYPDSKNYAYLCRDGSSQPLTEGTEPCIWLHRPWPVIIAKKKSAVAVAAIALSLANNTVTVDQHWRGALAALLEIHQAQPEPLQPPMVPMDYLAKAKGFREAYSQTGCDPPRHITLCSTSILAKNKCEWLSEAGAVYGVSPPLQCAIEATIEGCMEGTRRGEYVVQADSDWLLKGIRDYSLTPILHESNPIVDQTHTVVAYVAESSGITKMADLRGKRAAFPQYDGFAWHSVLRYITKKEDVQCKSIKDYFSQICAPGFEKMNVTDEVRERFTKSCYKEDDGQVVSGEMQALQALVEGKTDVAFIRMETYNLYAANKLPQFPWAKNPIRITPICPEENTVYCFLSWSNLGHIFTNKNITAMRKQEIINVFTKLDQLFGKHSPFHIAMFSMYGAFNHQMDVLFHNNTWKLTTDDILRSYPYNRIPLNFERSLSNSTDSCQLEDFTNFGARMQPSLMLLASLVLILSRYVYFYE
ncbi:unnamed protein product [Chilo suppressalis]|uniref:Transferrin-like domain-containing protein n=1 Tax=Chilo suppressalis TaxID=168631 RepID=A0ABN8B9F9_CHISP|nr:hypothetical protein evm_006310 [Chilo suppressalis]CAH0403905.1 unnamed protein product [Chilo suppressalis]